MRMATFRLAVLLCAMSSMQLLRYLAKSAHMMTHAEKNASQAYTKTEDLKCVCLASLKMHQTCYELLKKWAHLILSGKVSFFIIHSSFYHHLFSKKSLGWQQHLLNAVKNVHATVFKKMAFTYSGFCLNKNPKQT